MTRFVIGPDVALHLASTGTTVAAGHQVLAPTMIRSQVLSSLYRAVREGGMSAQEAERQLDHVRGLRMRLLGDRVLHRVAWKVADQLGWQETFTAEYVALTQLQAEAFVTLDAELARDVAGLVPVAVIEDLV